MSAECFSGAFRGDFSACTDQDLQTIQSLDDPDFVMNVPWLSSGWASLPAAFKTEGLKDDLKLVLSNEMSNQAFYSKHISAMRGDASNNFCIMFMAMCDGTNFGANCQANESLVNWSSCQPFTASSIYSLSTGRSLSFSALDAEVALRAELASNPPPSIGGNWYDLPAVDGLIVANW